MERPFGDATGRVVRATGGDVWVEVGGEVVACRPRGRLRGRGRGGRRGVRVAAGDLVAVSAPASGGRAIEDVAPRRSWLSRWVEREGGERMIAVNLDRVFVVTSLREPPARPEFVDRVLAAARRGDVPADVVVNKADLVEDDDLAGFRRVYEACGYPVLVTSAADGRGVDAVAARIRAGNVYAFVGESGVGKTSLLMRLDPSLDLRVGRVGARTGRGRHTTTFSQLYRFRDAYLADTPGVQTFGFPGDDPAVVPACFPEFAAYEGACRFDPCTHSHEPGCAVKDAVGAGRIEASRYESYRHILAEVEERRRRRRR